MLRKIIFVATILVASCTFAQSIENEVSEKAFAEELKLRGINESRGFLWDIEPFQDQVLYDVFSTENEKYNEMMMLAQYYAGGVPYVWGGGTWAGIDCSHFTQRVYNDVGVNYGGYLTTHDMKKVNENSKFVAVSKNNMKPGDLLVYGYYGIKDKQWHGHVVVLIDKAYKSSHGKKGLTVGSHSKVGVQFVSYTGFPKFFKYPFYKLVKVLRVKDL